MGAKDDYIKELQDELQRKNIETEAIRQEFQETLKSEEGITPAKLKESIEKMLPDALATAKELLAVAESESLRWSIAKFVISSRLGEGKNVEGEDVFGNLLKELTTQSKD